MFSFWLTRGVLSVRGKSRLVKIEAWLRYRLRDRHVLVTTFLGSEILNLLQSSARCTNLFGHYGHVHVLKI